MRHRLWIAALLLTVGLAGLAAGCGSSNTAAPPTGTTAYTETFASSSECAEFAGVAAKIAGAMSPASGSASAGLQAELNRLQLTADTAPSDIRNDFQTIVHAFSNFTQIVASSGYVLGQTTPPTAAQITAITTGARAVSTAKVRTAEQHLTAWANGNCK